LPFCFTGPSRVENQAMPPSRRTADASKPWASPVAIIRWSAAFSAC
jgi:hypothetical protein